MTGLAKEYERSGKRMKEKFGQEQWIYDISPAITSKLPVWPGDTPFSSEVLLDLGKGDSVTLSTVRTTVHLGAHADAPMHYGLDAPAIGERSLHYYLGSCQVIAVEVERGRRIVPSDIKVPIEAERVLLKTGTFPDYQNWNTDFAALSAEVVDYFHQKGVILVGIDTPSVDLMDSQDLAAHKQILAHDLAVLEGLVLTEVPAGVYELIALPLKLMGLDGSPVRAVLRKL